MRRYLPIFGWLPAYQRAWLAGDALAGLSVWALLVPQSLAYATLAGVPVQYGLYTAFAALLAYPLFGTSRQLARRPERRRLRRLRRGDHAAGRRRGDGHGSRGPYAAALAIATGAVYVALGLLRMGWVSTFLSKAVMAGFVLGFSIGIIIDQSHKLLGVAAGQRLLHAGALGRRSRSCRTPSATTLAVGGGSLALLLAMRYLRPKWPRALIVMVLAIVAVDRVRPRRARRRGHRRHPDRAVLGRHPGRRVRATSPRCCSAPSAIIFVGYSESLAAARAMARQARL